MSVLATPLRIYEPLNLSQMIYSASQGMYMVTPRHMGSSQATFSGMAKTASTCCSLNSPPFFTKSLRQTTTGDLELRIFGFWYLKDIENILVELVELYVE